MHVSSCQENTKTKNGYIHTFNLFAATVATSESVH